MPSPLYDPMHVAAALRNEAMPALHRLADHTNLRDRELRRFERDDPPPYESSTDGSEYNDPGPAPVGELSAAEQERFDAPLDDKERDHVALILSGSYSPSKRFLKEVDAEFYRIDKWAHHHADPEVTRFLRPLGSGKKIELAERRCAVVARHLVKRRWQKLGVWNQDWGIPEINSSSDPKDPSRNYSMDLWPWQHSEGPEPDMEARRKNDPVRRAIELRRGVRYEEHCPVVPRSNLKPSSSDAEGESFITSRPWFQLDLESSERSVRARRFPVREFHRLDNNTFKRWMDRGDWKDSWYDSVKNKLVGWKWRHESPSPEPEDLSGIDSMAALELTPSEVDALEGIPPPPATPPSCTPVPRPHYIEDPTARFIFGSLYETESAPLPPLSPSPPPSPPPPLTRLSRARPRRLAAAPELLAPRVGSQRVAKPRGGSRASAANPPQPPLRRSARIAVLASSRPPPAAAKPQPIEPQSAKPHPSKQSRARTKETPKQKHAPAKKMAPGGVTKQQTAPKRTRRLRK